MGTWAGERGLNQGGSTEDLVGHCHRGTVDRDVHGVRQDRRTGPDRETPGNVAVRRAEAEQHHVSDADET